MSSGYDFAPVAKFVGGYFLSLAVACYGSSVSLFITVAQQTPSSNDDVGMFYVAVAFFCLCVPIGWVPLLAGLLAARRFGSSRLARSLFGGLLTGVVLDVWVASCVVHLVGTDTETPPHVLRTMSISFLPRALIAGVIGGLIFWLVAGPEERRAQ